jgi:hypothetical protein
MAKQKLVVRSVQLLINKSKAETLSNLDNIVTILLSENLCLMAACFLAKKEFHLARLAAFWSLQKILTVQPKVQQVAESFAMVMKVLRVIGQSDNYKWVQEAAQIQIARALFCSELSMDGLVAIAKAYTEIMICG